MTDNRITVTGHAQVHVAPTVATWHLTIEVTDRQARVAYERCAEQATSIIEGLKASADIETSRCPPWRSTRASPRLRARRLNADGAPRAKARRPGPAGGECPPERSAVDREVHGLDARGADRLQVLLVDVAVVVGIGDLVRRVVEDAVVVGVGGHRDVDRRRAGAEVRLAGLPRRPELRLVGGAVGDADDVEQPGEVLARAGLRRREHDDQAGEALVLADAGSRALAPEATALEGQVHVGLEVDEEALALEAGPVAACRREQVDVRGAAPAGGGAAATRRAGVEGPAAGAVGDRGRRRGGRDGHGERAATTEDLKHGTSFRISREREAEAGGVGVSCRPRSERTPLSDDPSPSCATSHGRRKRDALPPRGRGRSRSSGARETRPRKSPAAAGLPRASECPRKESNLEPSD